jgi:hypothetical protein
MLSLFIRAGFDSFYKHVPRCGVGWEGTLFLELIGLPQAGMEFGGGGSSVEINRF